MKKRPRETGARALRLGRTGGTPLEARIARQEARLRRIDHQLERLEQPPPKGANPARLAASILRHQRAEDQVALEGMYLARARGKLELEGFAQRHAISGWGSERPVARLSAWINPPACLVEMGCLCAAHARGAVFWDDCDTTETETR